MNFNLYREHGALNSPPIFDALESGLTTMGLKIDRSAESIPVIWSVLWHGRMFSNKSIYQRCKKEKRPILIIEVGNLKRNETWRISLNHINNCGIFGNQDNLDTNRPKILNVDLAPIKEKRKQQILIACQHEKSLQWDGQPPMSTWVNNTINNIRRYTDMPIVVRNHPRSPFNINLTDVRREYPKKLNDTYDNFDIDYNYHCVINHNSGPAIQAAIRGIPVITDQTSLAYDISDSIENISNPSLKDRHDWFLKLCHTEWTVEEISKGVPIERLLPHIEKNLKNR